MASGAAKLVATNDEAPKTRKARKAAPENETKSDKFRRLARGRLIAAVGSLEKFPRLIAASYESTPEQREKIVNILQTEVDNIKKAFSAPDSKKVSREFDI